MAILYLYGQKIKPARRVADKAKKERQRGGGEREREREREVWKRNYIEISMRIVGSR